MQLKEADKFLHTTRQDTVIIEEKSSNGTVIHRYTKGKFLGKVLYFLVRVASQNAMSSLLWKMTKNTQSRL